MTKSVRLGKTIPHADGAIIKPAIFSKNNKYRYLLEIEFKDSKGNDSAVVILKNPSAATSTEADATIRRIEEYFIKNMPKVKSVKILNLFALRATDAIELNNESIDVVGIDNDSHILNACRNANLIICAWGGNSGINRSIYQSRINQVLLLIKNKPLFRISGKKKTIQPLHGMLWGYDYKLEKFLGA